MAKTLNGGALISYGPTLPPAATTPDGAMFYKTDSVVGGPQGLYVFGFVRDSNAGVLGYQVAQDWVQAASPDLFVLKGGDTMTGALQVPSYIKITQTSGSQRLLIGNQDSGGVNKPGVIDGANGSIKIGYGSTWAGNGGTLTNFLGIDASIDTGLTFRGIQVWHANNDGSGSGLDADRLRGSPPAVLATADTVAQRGSGAELSASRFNQSSGNSEAGTIAQLMYTNGIDGFLRKASIAQVAPAIQAAASGAWAITATHANTANSADTATNAQNAQNAVTASNVAWTGITGLTPTPDLGSSSLQTAANYPASGTTTYVRPSYFYDMGGAGTSSLAPGMFLRGSISGFDSLSSSDLGNYQVGLTVMGTAGSGARGFQLSANWDFEEAAPAGGLQYRVNDISSNVASWGLPRTIWDKGNLTALSQLSNDSGYTTAAAVSSAYVAKAGDTMTGTLSVPTLTVGSISAPAAGSMNIAGNITGLGFVSVTGNVVSQGAGIATLFSTEASGSGFTKLVRGNSTNTGYCEFFSANGTRQGLIGYSNSTGALDQGTINFWMATANFTGSIVAAGNVTAFSDIRLKRDIEIITDPIERVKKLRGVNFTRIADGVRGTGLLAQDVQEVLPEAVQTHEDGMMSVAYGNVVGLLVEVVKKQQAQLDAFKEELDRVNRLVKMR